MPAGAFFHYLICYDVADPRRLGRVHRLVSGMGLQVQYSVYHLRLDREGLDGLCRELETIIDPARDDVRIYRLPRECRALLMGRPCTGMGLPLFDGGENPLADGCERGPQAAPEPPAEGV